MFQRSLQRSVATIFSLAAMFFVQPAISQDSSTGNQTRSVFAVQLAGKHGVDIKGYVDPVRDVFVIESWVGTDAATWTPKASQLPLTLYALTPDSHKYDVPDDWDGQLDGWAFVQPEGMDTRSIEWNEGTPTTFWEGSSLGWGGLRNRRNTVVIAESRNETKRFRYVPKNERTMSDISFETVDVRRVERTLPNGEPARTPAPSTTPRVVDARTGHAYQRINIPMSWYEAKKFCEQLGGHLATITSPEENEFVYRNFAHDHVCWLGASDEETEGEWKWITDEPWDYTNWFQRGSQNTPDNVDGTEHYLVMGTTTLPLARDGVPYHYRFGAKWNDHAVDGVYCDVTITYPVCEWDVQKSAQPLPPQKSTTAGREVLVRDDFDGQSNVRWDILRADPASLSLTTRPGFLVITTQPGDIIGRYRSAKNIYLTSAPQPFENVAITTCVCGFAPQAPWNQAGLLCYADDDNYIKFTIENLAGGRRKLVTIREVAGDATIHTAVDPDPEATRLWLRIVKHKAYYAFFVSVDGEQYRPCGRLPFDPTGALNAPRSIGLFAINGPDSTAPRLDAAFDFVEVRRWTESRTHLAWTLEEALHQLQLYPRDPYLQYVALQLARREGRLPETSNLVRGIAGRPADPQRTRLNDADLFSIFTGALAVQESLQLEEMGGGIPGRRPPPQAAATGETVPVSELAGPMVRSHPWKEMLAGRTPDISPLARSVPADFYFVQFQSVDKLFDVMSSSDLWGTHLFNQSVQDATLQPIAQQIQRQLALELNPSLRSIYESTVDEVAVTGSDLFVSEGSDLTILFQLKQPEPFRAQMDSVLADVVKTTPGIKRVLTVVQGVPVEQLSSPDRSINVFSAYPSPELHVRSNSRVAFERILAAIKGQNAGGEAVVRLGDTDEFAYIRTLMDRGAAEEDGFVYLSDPFIRRMVGAEVKLTERRRMLCYNHLRMIGHASLLYATERGKAPESLEELVGLECLPPEFGRGALRCPDGGNYRLSDDGHTGVCSHHGHTHSMTPCCEIPVAVATAEESLLYRTFVDNYNTYWTTFFDPIALRIQATPERYRIETIVLPLIDNTVYAGLASVLGGEPEPLDALPVPERNIFSVAVRVNKRPILTQLGLEHLLDEAEPASPPWQEALNARVNTLRQVAVATLNYESSKRVLPTAVAFDNQGRRNRLSWRVHLLPYMGQNALYDEFHLDEPWDSPHNKQLIARMPDVYRPDNPQLAAAGKTRLVAPFNEKCLFSEQNRSLALRAISDGMSNTILAMEADDEHAVIWTKPDDLEVDLSKPKRGLNRREPGAHLVAMVDGSVHFLREEIEDDKLVALLTYAGREVVRIGSQDEILLQSLRPRRAWRVDESLVRMGIGELLTKGIGNQIGLHMYDDEPLFDFSLPQLLGWSMGSFNNRRGFRFDNDMLGPVFLAASLNAPVYVSIPVVDAEVVDGFLDRLDDHLALLARRREGFGFFRVEQDFYHLEGEAGSPIRVYGLRLGPVSWQVYWARIGNGVYIASQRSIFNDLRAMSTSTAPATDDHGPPAHAMARLRPEHWDRVLASYRLGWEANNRRACLHNLGPMASLGRAVVAILSREGLPADQSNLATAASRASSDFYGVEFYCPDGGHYMLSRDGNTASCSVHGTVLEPRQQAAPAEQSQLASLVRDIREMTVTLTFLEDGLHAVVEMDRTNSPPDASSAKDRSRAVANVDRASKVGSEVQLQHVEPTTIGPQGHHRRGVRLDNAPVLEDRLPLLAVPLDVKSARDLSITRLFWCLEMSVPLRDRVYTGLDVNLWVPVPDGPFTRVAIQQGAQGQALVRPTRPLPDGVYALHNGDLDAEETTPPTFFAPFVVRGYGVPKITGTKVDGRESPRFLDVTIRNTGDGAFDDGFLVVTLQRREGRQSKFMRRRHGDLLPIAPGREQTISQRWDTSKLEPGTYYFYGHVNYKYLWDVNSLDTFHTEDFEIVGEAKE